MSFVWIVFVNVSLHFGLKKATRKLNYRNINGVDESNVFWKWCSFTSRLRKVEKRKDSISLQSMCRAWESISYFLKLILYDLEKATWKCFVCRGTDYSYQCFIPKNAITRLCMITQLYKLYYANFPEKINLHFAPFVYI